MHTLILAAYFFRCFFCVSAIAVFLGLVVVIVVAVGDVVVVAVVVVVVAVVIIVVVHVAVFVTYSIYSLFFVDAVCLVLCKSFQLRLVGFINF